MVQEKIEELPNVLIESEVLEDLHKKVSKKQKKQKKRKTRSQKKSDPYLGISNPRYFEEARTPKKAFIERDFKYGDLTGLRQ